MRIITVNLPVSYIKAIAKLTGSDGMYPSRSELIRVAVRSFLIREIESAQAFEKYAEQKAFEKTTHDETTQKELDEDLYVQVPQEDGRKKTYKIVKK
jgi:Arc/MetJ-type ribon-helix-helix transcriptional regulator